MLDAFASELEPADVDPELGISVKTVEAHVSAVLRKLQLSNRHQLSRWAIERRLVIATGASFAWPSSRMPPPRLDLRSLELPVVAAQRPSGPGWILAANRVTAPLARRIPAAAQDRMITTRRPSHRFLGPQPPTDDGRANLLDSDPLYAGMNVDRIAEIRPATEPVKALAP